MRVQLAVIIYRLCEVNGARGRECLVRKHTHIHTYMHTVSCCTEMVRRLSEKHHYCAYHAWVSLLQRLGWVYTWQVDTLLYRRVLNLPDSRARCLVIYKYMEAHSANRYWRASTRNLHSSAICVAMCRAVGGLINCTVVKTRMLTPEIALPVTNSVHSKCIGIDN